MTTLDHTSLDRWRDNPIAFIETVLNDPETKKPFVLLDAERRFLEHAFTLDDAGRLLYPEQVYSCPKKSGKTTFAGIFTLTFLLLHGGAYPEGVCLANDQEQAQGRVFTMIRRIIECSLMLKAIAKITEYKITFPALDVSITAIPSSAAGAAGGNQNIAVFDELWAVTSERSRRLWDEMVPPPTRRIGVRLTTTYAGFTGESTLLEELHRRGMAQPEIGPDLRAGDGLLMFWSHTPVAPWQDEKWLAEMRRTLRPSAYSRLVLNEFAAAESAFIDMSSWDACVQSDLTPVQNDKRIAVYIGVDASVKRDSTALVAITINRKTQAARLVQHRIFTPTPDNPINFEHTVEATLLDWAKRYRVKEVLFDPFQLIAVSQRLAKARIPVEEFAQSVPNLTAAVQNLLDMIQGRTISFYPDEQMRTAVSRAVIVESARGQRLDKTKQHFHIDVVVALSMAALAAVRGLQEPDYDAELLGLAFADGTKEQTRESRDREFQNQLRGHILASTGYWLP
jgi:phage terminase large subunit-like protein